MDLRLAGEAFYFTFSHLVPHEFTLMIKSCFASDRAAEAAGAAVPVVQLSS